MSQTIELESIRRLDIKPGQILVFTMPSSAHAHDSTRVSEVLEKLLPGVKIIVVSHGVELSVLCPSSPASPVDD